MANREPALHDKDAYWGMTDDKEDVDDVVERELLERQEEKTTKQSRKKDSGYCESYGDCWIKRQDTSSTLVRKKSTLLSPALPDNNNNNKSIRRAVSTNTPPHARIPTTAFKSILPPIHSKQQQQQQDQQQQHNNNNSLRRNSTPVTPSAKNRQSSISSYHCSAIFGGGMISSSSVIHHQEQPLLMDPFEIITCTPALKLAEQLTWIETEIFYKIQPRDFLRHQKNKHKQLQSGKEKNPVLASIEHFNFVSGWIASLVVNQAILEKRTIVFEYCLQIAVVSFCFSVYDIPL